ncbi:MAG: DUF1638 domain-containing protein [Candidatus Sumerlaeota bacterium]|nr:DUF1638 domain-containing protein [Candidatus Sumerlaeota bacterium]
MSSSDRIHVISCGVLALDLRAVAERLGVEVSMRFLPGGLHNVPNELRRLLQEAIDEASTCGACDRIAIGYGVCGRGAVGLQARNVPLVIPRVHDCISLFLGSDAAYREQFAKCPGTYYVAAGWVEEKVKPKPMDDAARKAGGQPKSDFAEMVRKHGRENADAVRRFMNSWQRNYKCAAFIDTGAGGQRDRYAKVARDMAGKYGWAYEELAGTDALLSQLLQARESNNEVLVVPPHHVTIYDPLNKGLQAVPFWEGESAPAERRHTLVFQSNNGGAEDGRKAARLGLGIDAGGTYTDAVLYDFQKRAVLEKAKALTTKWDFAIGIEGALEQLSAGRLAKVDLVSISTTLATNAIVEGRGQRVGLLIMPPYGLFAPEDIAHRPLAVIEGRLEIDGSEIAPIDEEQVRRAAREMVDVQDVAAFAVTGYASHINPSHELRVKEIIQEETRLGVVCGHDVSELLNYRVRAQTAALNARIIPCLDALVERVQVSLRRRGIHAPVMIVRSDGSLMNVATARRRPIETVLSGPAASVAGARFLVQESDALVVDMGGTTTDTATIRNGAAPVCEQGASVGGWRTHVKALAMRTLGLGGDSRIALEKRELRIGPQRIAPAAWLAGHHPRGGEAFDWLERHIDHFAHSTQRAELLMLNGSGALDGASDSELRIVDMLNERPHSLHELARRLTGDAFHPLPLERLEENHRIQRCGLTPTDLLHANGRIALWDADAARRMCDWFSRLWGEPREEFIERALRQVVVQLAVELLKKQLDETADAETLDASPAAMALVRNWLDGGAGGWRARIALNHPVIGIGAPAHLFLPAAAELLEAKAIIPPHADVANAIGAITSSVFLHKRVRIAPNDSGRFSLLGLPDAPAFARFDDAHAFAVERLQAIVRDQALRAGTSETRVEIAVEDEIASAAGGEQLFLGRTLEARLSGPPDLARL